MNLGAVTSALPPMSRLMGKMLLMSESIILEVLDSDGHQVPSGETGEAVMTGLCSDAQPFIRYRTGDMLTLSSESDKTGRGLHVIENVRAEKQISWSMQMGPLFMLYLQSILCEKFRVLNNLKLFSINWMTSKS